MMPRVILYAGLLLVLAPLWGLWVYMQAFLSSVDPEFSRFLVDKVVMLGMFSWPLWLGLPFFAIFKRRVLKKAEILIAFVPMTLVFSAYYRVLFAG